MSILLAEIFVIFNYFFIIKFIWIIFIIYKIIILDAYSKTEHEPQGGEPLSAELDEWYENACHSVT